MPEIGSHMSNIRIGNEQLAVEVSTLGSEMQSITTSDGQDWLWDGDAAFWSGRSPVLFPIVGRARDDHVRIDGVRYPMGQHGFARRSEFELVAQGADFCRMALRAGQASHSIFPFDFLLELEHRVEERGVSVTAEVTNRDHRPMPFGIGFIRLSCGRCPAAMGWSIGWCSTMAARRSWCGSRAGW